MPFIAVCFPYEFTLLSNVAATCTTDGKFVSPTNLHCSQTIVLVLSLFIGLFPLRIYTALKQSLLIGLNGDSLFPLRIYTALKQRFYRVLSLPGLFPLRIYTALKLFTLFSIYSIRLFPLRIYTALKLTQKPRKSIKVCFPYEFTLLSNCAYYHNLKFEFVSPTNLHCSQTSAILFFHVFCLFPLRIYTALKLNRITFTEKLSLFPLRIYTALKPQIVQE